MKLAQASVEKFEAFFREIYNDDRFQMPAIYVYPGKFSKNLTAMLRIHGITIGKSILVSPEVISHSENNRTKLNHELAAHEITHVLQFRREGFVVFFYKYFRDYWRNLKQKGNWNAVSRQQAYLEIPFEIEARQIAAKFVEWNANSGKR